MLSDGRAIRIGSPFELCCPHLFDTPIENKSGDRHRHKAKAIWIRFTNISITYFWLVVNSISENWSRWQESEPTPRLRRAGQVALRSRWSLQISDLFVILQLEAVSSICHQPHSKRPPIKSGLLHWSWWQESNLQPAVYDTAALPLSHTSNIHNTIIIP